MGRKPDVEAVTSARQKMETLISQVHDLEDLAFSLKADLSGPGDLGIDRDLLRKAQQDEREKFRINIVLTKSDLTALESIMLEHGINNRSAMIRYLIRLSSR